MRSVRRLPAIAVAAATLALIPAPPADATSKPATLGVDAAWGSADATVVRDGWTVSLTGTLEDTRDDGDCVYVKSTLVVEDYYDQDERTANLCAGPGATRDFEHVLSPDYGSRLVEVVVRVCAADSLADSCQEETLPVPAERAVRPDLKRDIDRYMRMPMAEFLRARASAPGPFDWGSDGCSDSPDEPAGWNFRDACYRHDFGYRNYGGGPIQASPTDETRADADERFRADLRDECDRVEERRRCRALAETYYEASRRAGGKAFYS